MSIGQARTDSCSFLARRRPRGHRSVEDPLNAVPVGRLAPGGGGEIGGSGQAERGDSMYLYVNSPAKRPDAPVLSRHVPLLSTRNIFFGDS